MKVNQTIQQTQRLAPQQILLASLIAATSDELEQIITEETEKNVALEIDDKPSDNISATDNTEESNTFDINSDKDTDEEPLRGDSVNDEESFFENDDDSPSDCIVSNSEEPHWSPLLNYSADTTSREDLHEQIGEMDLEAEEEFLARYIIDSLDDSGYLTISLQMMVDDLELNLNHKTTIENLEGVLVEVVQSLEPAGIGARNLRECLLLQLAEKRGTLQARLAYQMVDECFDEMSKKQYERICERLNIDGAQLKHVLNIVSHLNPRPGGMMANADRIESKAAHIRPDFSIHVEDGELEIMLLDGGLPTVRISSDYEALLESMKRQPHQTSDSKQGMALINDSINAGRAFIEALKQRQETLLRVIKAIAMLQKNYFISAGDKEQLKPMVLKDVAEYVHRDISTISRVSNSKYIDTDFGVIPVRDLFSTGIQTENGDSISNMAVQNALRELIEEEDKKKPYSDDVLAAELNKKGYPVARRTVAKYREAMGIATARMRREL